jgi:hypothetical protein
MLAGKRVSRQIGQQAQSLVCEYNGFITGNSERAYVKATIFHG